MLSKLYIENYALIDRLEISFSQGFTVITGETGAGKSILLGALALVLGQRADSTMVLEGSRRCIVEGIFRIGGYGLERLFSDHDLSFDEELILRREIWQNGKTRAFINDSPVNLGLMKELGDRLLNIHSQHSVITLNDADFQLSVLDDYAGIQKKVERYRTGYFDYLDKKRRLEDLVGRESKERSEADYRKFLLDELVAAGLKEGEKEEAEKRLEFVTHAEEIRKKLSEASGILADNDLNILSQLSSVSSFLGDIASFQPELGELAERLRTNLVDLKDISNAVSRLEQGIEVYPEEQETLSARLDMIYRLERKHNAGSPEELIRIREDLERKILEAGSLEENIRVLEKAIAEDHAVLSRAAEEISAGRKAICGRFEKKITGILAKLGMPDGRLKIEMDTVDNLTRDGRDTVRFLFSANKGVSPGEISRIASGGELSRLMLSVKSVISGKNLLPTIIFDEIDSGVSGEIAGRVGSILKSMAGTMQVVAITHLPQIAGKGDHHFKVYKTAESGPARTRMAELDFNDRVMEIAKMMSSEKVTDSALKTAKELIKT